MNKAERIERAKVEFQDAINKYGYSLQPDMVLSILATLGAVWVADDQTPEPYDADYPPRDELDWKWLDGFKTGQQDMIADGWRKVEGA